MEQSEEALSKTSDELRNTVKILAEKEKYFTSEITKRDQSIDSLKNISDAQRLELKKTKDALKDASRENAELKEHLEATQKSLDVLESKVCNIDTFNILYTSKVAICVRKSLLFVPINTHTHNIDKSKCTK